MLKKYYENWSATGHSSKNQLLCNIYYIFVLISKMHKSPFQLAGHKHIN